MFWQFKRDTQISFSDTAIAILVMYYYYVMCSSRTRVIIALYDFLSFVAFSNAHPLMLSHFFVLQVIYTSLLGRSLAVFPSAPLALMRKKKKLVNYNFIDRPKANFDPRN